MNINKYKRSVLAQFRSGILPLQIEVGRYRNIQLCDRICPMCNLAVEDEIHFLCQCPKYSDVRAIVFNAVSLKCDRFMSIDVLDQFVFLMSNLQKEVMNFLLNAMQQRTNCLTYC